MNSPTQPGINSGLAAALNRLTASVAPPPDLKISEWAEEFRMLSPEASARPGKFYVAKAPYQREMMDALCSGAQHVVFMTSAQIGKTEILNNITGYFMHQDPAPILIVQPTLEMAEAWSKDRLSPMLRDSPALRDLIGQKRRDGENSILHKKFPGGHITAAGANSPASLASRPIRIVLLDETDRFPRSAGKEGDPCELAVKRTTTFWNRVILYASTPTVKGESKIEEMYEKSDRRRFFVPCPSCGHMQILNWERLSFDANPAAPVYVCAANGCVIEHGSKAMMLKGGEWRPTAKAAEAGIVGFSVNELYSPWVSWAEMAQKFLSCKGVPDKLKSFINLSLGESWDENYLHGEGVKSSALLSRKEKYLSEIPAEAAILTCGIDVQEDRLELEILAWGAEEENWSVDYKVLYGSPAEKDVWLRLDDVLEKVYPHPSGAGLRIAAACIDTGGKVTTEETYRYCKRKRAERKPVYPVKGRSDYGKPIVTRPVREKTYGINLFMIGTDTAKNTLKSRLEGVKSPGPGFCHFPDHYDDEYFNQLTAERLVKRYQKGQTVKRWECPKGRRNEALDCRVYNIAAFHILRPNMAKHLERLGGVQKPAERAAPAVKVSPAENSGRTDGPAPETMREYLRRMRG